MMRIHKQGTYLITGVTLTALAVIAVLFLTTTLSLWTILAAVVLLPFVYFIFYFFRNPRRTVEVNESRVLSPADGKVVVIEKVHEAEFLGRECTQISIFMSPLNVHLNRFPVSGYVVFQKYFPGKYLVAWHPKSSTLNERNVFVLEDGKERRYLLRQIAGAVARRIVWFAKEGDTCLQGAEMGFIKLGSRVDILLPVEAEICVKLGDKVRGGITLLAKYNES